MSIEDETDKIEAIAFNDVLLEIENLLETESKVFLFEVEVSENGWSKSLVIKKNCYIYDKKNTFKNKINIEFKNKSDANNFYVELSKIKADDNELRLLEVNIIFENKNILSIIPLTKFLRVENIIKDCSGKILKKSS